MCARHCQLRAGRVPGAGRVPARVADRAVPRCLRVLAFGAAGLPQPRCLCRGLVVLGAGEPRRSSGTAARAMGCGLVLRRHPGGVQRAAAPARSRTRARLSRPCARRPAPAGAPAHRPRAARRRPRRAGHRALGRPVLGTAATLALSRGLESRHCRAVPFRWRGRCSRRQQRRRWRTRRSPTMDRPQPLFTASALATLLATATAQAPQRADLREVPFPQVTVADPFFAPRRATNQKVTLAHSLQQLEATGTLGNFDLAAAGKHTGFKGYVFQDSDAYKAIEAIAFALAAGPDPELDQKCDAVIARIAASQQPDGYLDSWYTVNAPDKRFTNLRDNHELYCAGHLFEAAAAHFRATGWKNLLDVATRYADLLCRTFGDGPGKRPGYCGHPEVELALVKLADVTGKNEYFELAAHFVRARGSKFFATEHGDDVSLYDGTYWLDHAPICDLQAIAGHAVRATYLMSGAVDTGARTHDEPLLQMTRRVWRNTMERNVFVTGGIGPSASNEGFTHDYDLPTFSAYQESCASVAIAMWAHRLNLLYGDARYADAMERALYNAIPAGVQLDGTRFFYTNPLASRGQHHRREWFGCACCPPNIARTLAAIGSYAYATGPDSLWVNLFVQGKVEAEVAGEKFALEVTTDYPWDGKVLLKVLAAPRKNVTLDIRVPAWTRIRYQAEVGDQQMTKGHYLALLASWQPGNTIELEFELPVRRLEADPRAEALRGG